MGIFKKIKKAFKFGNTLYYPGCLTKFVLPHIEENYKKIFKKIGLNFISLPDFEMCCGSPVKNAGYSAEFKELNEKFESFLKEYNITKIITNCPSCYEVLSKSHPDIEVEHATVTIFNNATKLIPEKIILENTKENKQLLDNKKPQVTYHDPCHLGRKSGIYEQPRQVLKALGYEVLEFTNTKINSLCCGGGGGLLTNNKDLANDICKKRLHACKAKTLVTPCPMCYQHFKNNAKDVKVLEFSEVILKHVKA